ncbi:hypothetical protein [Mucilaginibacter sp.]|uniref:hypothetical protein n=1 Tax=Mucilaginibacter sp. TaxID=1882438 RepID=UPI0025FB6E53|nr:hypothetical protein [Mucilaginibacter sp.]
MKTTYLFPAWTKYLGAILAVPGFILGYLVVYQNYSIPGLEIRLRSTSTLFLSAVENFTNELALTLVVVGLLLVAFSRTKKEDELTAKIRLNSLYWAILVNYILYACFALLAFVGYLLKSTSLNKFIDDLTNNLEYTVYNFFVPLVIFIGRFYFLLYRNKNEFDIKQVHYLPYKPYRQIGKWVSIVIMAIVAANEAFNWSNALSNLFWLLPLSLLLWIFSTEKTEDEYINATRLDAMQVAVYVNYAVLLLSNWLVYGIGFLYIQLVNLVTIPLIFIGWFYYRVYRISRQTEVKSI